MAEDAPSPAAAAAAAAAGALAESAASAGLTKSAGQAAPLPGFVGLLNATAAHEAALAEQAAAHAQHHHLKPRDATFVLWTTIFVLVAAQYALTFFRKRYPRGHQITSLVGLWLVPLVVALGNHSWRFLAVWAAFSAAAAYFVALARAKPMAKDTPGKVYAWLDATYRGCLAGATLSVSTTGALVLLPFIARHLPIIFLELLLSAAIYSVYFGVLIRDIGELASELLASNLGYKARKGDDDDGGGGGGGALARSIPRYNTTCALCNGELRIVGEGSAVEETEEGGLTEITQPVLVRAPDGLLVVVYPGTPVAAQMEAALAERRRAAAGASGASPSEEQRILQFPGHDGRPLFQLQCKHVFHEGCVKGWCVVGKKNTCPCCSERVDLKVLLKTSAVWGRPSVMWGQLLDVVRYVVVWNPVIFLLLRLIFYEAGVTPVS
jgi:RING finger protein 121